MRHPSLQVCPRPQKQYKVQIGLKLMEEQAIRTAEMPQCTAKLALEVLASRVEAHFAHLRSPLTIANCDNLLGNTTRVGFEPPR